MKHNIIKREFTDRQCWTAFWYSLGFLALCIMLSIPLYSQIPLTWEYNPNACERVIEQQTLLIWQGIDTLQFDIANADTVEIFTGNPLVLIPCDTGGVIQNSIFQKLPESKWFRGVLYHSNRWGNSGPAISPFYNCEVPDKPENLKIRWGQ